VRLDRGEVVQLPIPVALVDGDGREVTASPEWQGPSPGTVSFHTGYAQLLVAVNAASHQLDVLMRRLLEELVAAAAQPGADGLRVSLLAAGLRLVAGRPVLDSDRGGADRVFQLAHAGITARTQGVRVVALPPPRIEVPAPAALALAMVQFAVNASHHEGAQRVVLRVSPGPSFYVEWPSLNPHGVHVETHRQQSQRARWGWGYVQMVADALGAAALPPGPTGPSSQGACVGLGSVRLTLPLACVQNGFVSRSTEAWDQDSGAAFGSHLTEHLAALVGAARARPGKIVSTGLFSARATGETTWLCMPPEEGVDRARDVLRGLVHERALVRAPEPHATRIYALAGLLERGLGGAPATVPPSVWHQDLPIACGVLGVTAPLAFDSLILPDPRVTAYLLAEIGGKLVGVGDELRLEPPPNSQGELLQALDRDENGLVLLS
jgi:hypothetical protein